MTVRSASRLERLLRAGIFVVTAEVVPPRSADGASVTAQARSLVGYADAVNVTDNPTSSAHMSAVAGSALVHRAGLEPVIQMTSRDRNRLALTADLLGAWALGARNILCLSGDSVSAGDHPDATEVNDLDVIELVGLAARLRGEGRVLSGATVDPAPRFFVGVADVPLVRGYDFGRLERKADAGADFVQTQIVFDPDAFREWADEARRRGLLERMFVLAGVAVAGGPKTARYMREHLYGVVVPDEVIGRLDGAGSGEAETVGVGITVEIIAKLKTIAGIAGIHVMGLGRMAPLRSTIARAGLLPRPA